MPRRHLRLHVKENSCQHDKFVEHISSQLRKAYAKASALGRIRRFVPMDVMLALCKSFILPHLEYCSPLLLGMGKVQANKGAGDHCLTKNS